jgi:hypothetical protein
LWSGKKRKVCHQKHLLLPWIHICYKSFCFPQLTATLQKRREGELNIKKTQFKQHVCLDSVFPTFYSPSWLQFEKIRDLW